MIHWLEQHLFTCFFKAHFGIECPGCGLQRAFISLLKGNLSESIHYHAALIPFIITWLLLFAQLILKRDNGGKVVMWSFILTCAVMIVQFVIRQVTLFS
jgi:hypothetical protein